MVGTSKNFQSSVFIEYTRFISIPDELCFKLAETAGGGHGRNELVK